MHSKRAVALALVLLGIMWLPAGAAGGAGPGGDSGNGGAGDSAGAARAGPVQTLDKFSSGANNTTIYFTAPGNDSSTGISIPVDTTVTSATVDLYSKEQCENASFNVGGGDPEWSVVGPIPLVTIHIEFTQALEVAARSLTPAGGMVTVPITLHGETKGNITLFNLLVKYVSNKPPDAPVLEAPGDGAWCTSPRPTFRCNATDPDGDTIWYYLEIYRNGSATPSRMIDQRQGLLGWSGANQSSGQGGAYTPPTGAELDNGERYSWRAAAWDGYTFGPWSDFRVLPVDLTPPSGTVIDDGAETSVPDTLHALLSLNDTESGVQLFQYKLGTNLNASDLSGPANTTSPDVTVRDLTLVYGRKYYFTARAQNGAGLWSAWASSNGISLKKGVINHLPTVSISLPAEGANLTGLVQVNGTAEDMDFLDYLEVQLKIDSSEWTAVQGNRSWLFSWDTTLYSNGSHTVYARAYDQVEYSDKAMVNVSIVNKRDIEITSTSPAQDPGINESESQAFSVSARDPLGHELRYQWSVDGILQPGSVTRTFTYIASHTSAGVHAVRVSVLYGTREAGWNWTLTVANVNRPPVAVISAPANGTGYSISRTVSFDSAGSADPDTDDSLNFTWDFGDGTRIEGRQATHVYVRPGKVIVVLLIADGHDFNTTAITLNINEGASVQKDFFTQALSEPWCPVVLVLGIVGLVALAVMALRSRRPKPAARPGAGPAPAQAPAPGPQTMRPEDQARRRAEAARRQAQARDGAAAARGPPGPPPSMGESPTAGLEEEAREAVRRQAAMEAAAPEAPAEAVPEAVAMPAEEASNQALPFGLAGTRAPASRKSADTGPAAGQGAEPEAPAQPSVPPPENTQAQAELDVLLGQLTSDKPGGEK